MKKKEGRDYLTLNDCIVSVNDKNIILQDMASHFIISMVEFDKLVKFIQKSKVEKNDQ